MRKYGIIADTSCETTEQMREKYGITYASFKIDIDDKSYIDNEDLDLEDFITSMNASKNPIKTACPSPGDFNKALEENKDCDELFIITISKKLSGTYDSASLASQLFREKYPDKKVHVIDSKSAAAGETNVYLELIKVLDENIHFEEIINKISTFVENMKTMFVLEDLSNLIKNGRMPKTAGMIANALSIKPVMKGINGEIELHEIARGVNNSLNKMIKSIGTFVEDTTSGRIVVTHVRAPEKVEKIVEGIKKAYDFGKIEVVQARGLSSGYAADKGIVIAFD